MMTYQEMLVKRAERDQARASRAINAEFEALKVNPRKGRVMSEEKKPQGRGGVARALYAITSRKNTKPVIMKASNTKPIVSSKRLICSMDYIAREGQFKDKEGAEEVTLYDSEGYEISRDEYKAKAEQWAREERKGVQIVRPVIFSIADNSEPAAFKQALLDTIEAKFKAHGLDLVYSFHNDTDHPHAHLLVRTHNKERTYYFHPQSKDLREIKQYFAERFNSYAKTMRMTVDKPKKRTHAENLERKKNKKDIAQLYAMQRKREKLEKLEREKKAKEQEARALFEHYQQKVDAQALQLAQDMEHHQKIRYSELKKQQEQEEIKKAFALKARKDLEKAKANSQQQAYRQDLIAINALTTTPPLWQTDNQGKYLVSFKAISDNGKVNIVIYPTKSKERAEAVKELIKDVGTHVKLQGIYNNKKFYAVLVQKDKDKEAHINQQLEAKRMRGQKPKSQGYSR